MAMVKQSLQKQALQKQSLQESKNSNRAYVEKHREKKRIDKRIDMVLLEAKVEDMRMKNEKQNNMIMELLNNLALLDQKFHDMKNERDICRDVLAKWIAMDQMENLPVSDVKNKLSLDFIIQPEDNVRTKWLFINSFYERNKYMARAFNDTLVEASDEEFQKFSDRKVGQMKRRRLKEWCDKIV